MVRYSVSILYARRNTYYLTPFRACGESAIDPKALRARPDPRAQSPSSLSSRLAASTSAASRTTSPIDLTPLWPASDLHHRRSASRCRPGEFPLLSPVSTSVHTSTLCAGAHSNHRKPYFLPQQRSRSAPMGDFSRKRPISAALALTAIPLARQVSTRRTHVVHMRTTRTDCSQPTARLLRP